MALKKRKEEATPEMGEGSKISSLPLYVSRHVEIADKSTGVIRLWFSSNNLKVVPEHVYKNEELVHFLGELLITNNHVKKMQPYIDLCENLTKLVLNNNLIKKLPTNFTQLKKLRYLDFGNNDLKKFPATNKVKTLETIIGDHNKLKKIPANAFNNDSLYSINISNNLVKNLPKTMYKKPIAFLNASYNNIESLPKLPPRGILHLNYLDVSHCKLTSLPPDFNRLKCLAYLDLSHNKLCSLALPSPDGYTESDVSFFPHFITHLNVSNNQIIDVDHTLLRLKGLVILNMSHNELIELPEDLDQLECLEELYISNNSLVRLPSNFHKLSRLKVLDVSFNSITDIEGLEKLPSCTTFEAAHNDITSLPADMTAMTSLLRFDLSFNKLTEIPISLGRIGTLKDLNLSHNYLTVIPEELGIAQILKKLDLSFNELSQLPWDLRKWRMLTHLYLSKNELSFLHKNFHSMFNELEVLELQDNALTELTVPNTVKQLNLSHNSPHQIEKVLNKSLILLEKLCLSGLELGEVPSNLLSRYHLVVHLDLSRNQLIELPTDMIVSMKQLKYLDCSFNELVGLPDEVPNLKYLEHLNCSHNQIKKLPNELLRCPLNRLIISNNRIKELKLPSQKSDMDKIKPFPLTYLDISVNQFEVFHRNNLELFASLKHFDAHGNYLTWLHPHFTSLYRLEYLNLSENDLIHLPNDFNRLTRIKELHLKDNLLTAVPDSLCKMSGLDVLDVSHNKIASFPKKWDSIRLNQSIEMHCDFQRKEKRDPRRFYDESEAVLIMTGKVQTSLERKKTPVKKNRPTKKSK